MRTSVPFILASRSPRRRFLLRQLGFSFSVIPADIDESLEETRQIKPSDLARKLSLRKARKISHRRPDALVLGADTLVVHRGRILGKPSDKKEAFSMLRRLSGSTHTVYTAIALIHASSDRSVANTFSTEVTFGRLSDREIRHYVATDSPMDKAGGYGIQDEMGTVFIKEINGDYYTVVGLPMRGLYKILTTEFSDLFVL